jgi:hypothetical protein
MGTGVKIENSKDIRFIGGQISGFDKGIEAINSDVTLQDIRISNCNIGVESHNSTVKAIRNSVIQQCAVGIDSHNSDIVVDDSILLDNVLNMVVESSSISLINSLSDKIIFTLDNIDIKNKDDIVKLAQETKSAKGKDSKKALFKKLLKYLKVLKDIATVYSLLKDIIKLAGVTI